MKNRLEEIIGQLGFEDLRAQLDRIPSGNELTQAPVVLPLVGEFSAGKTTLINALSETKALESASEPTTSTIYTIHFGAEQAKAIVHLPDGKVNETSDIGSLHNKELCDAVLVDVYDPSSIVPSSIMLVDTPGLSSHDIKHRQNLVEFLPQADGVLLVVDVNQPITRSLTDFAHTIELSKRPLYMVLTQCDTKSPDDVESQKRYILNNTDLHLSGIACVSAKTGNISELIELFNTIQSEKSHILSVVNEQRCKDLAATISRRIDTILRADENESDIEDEIRRQKLQLNKLHRDMENSDAEISSQIDEAGRTQSRKFEDEIFTRLETIVSGKCSDYDSEALAAINNTASIFLNEFKAIVRKIVVGYSSKYNELTGVDLDGHSISGIGYDINLNEAGHEYDNTIGNIVKGVAVVGAVVATAGIASAAGGAAVAGEAAAGAAGSATAATAATATRGVLVAADVADTVTDVASIVSNRRMQKRIDTAVRYGKAISENIDRVNDLDNQTGARLGQRKGIVQSMVGFFTERTMGRPQRRRAITQYIDSTLAPQFKSELGRIGSVVSADVSKAILASASASVSAVTDALNEMVRQRDSQKEAYEAKINELKSIKKELRQYE